MQEKFITVDGAQVDPKELERQGWTPPAPKDEVIYDNHCIEAHRVRIVRLANGNYHLYGTGDAIGWWPGNMRHFLTEGLAALERAEREAGNE